MASKGTRRSALIGLGGAGIAIAAAPILLGGFGNSDTEQEISLQDQVPIRDTDFVLGSDTAPITLFKYGSLTCPHCAAFHMNTARALKERHIEEGLLRYVHRHFPLNQPAMAGAMLLHSGEASADRFYALIDILYSEQGQWARSEDYMEALVSIGARTGVNRDDFNALMGNKALSDRILAERKEGADVYGVNSTPTLLINGKRYSGNHSVSQLEEIFEHIV